MSIKFRCTCGKAYKVSESNAGRKMVCKGCNKTLRVPQGAPIPAAPESEEFEFNDDSSRDMRPIASAPPPLVNVKRKRPRPDEEEKGAQVSGGRKKAIIALLGLFAIVGMGGAGYLILSNANSSNAAAELQKYTKFSSDNLSLTLEYPEGWEAKSKEGNTSAPPWASFEDGTAHIAVRASISGMLINDIQSAGQLDTGDEDANDDLSPLAQTHDFQAQKIALDYKEWQDGPSRTIKIPYGDVRISEFNANEGFGASDLQGYRVTMTGSQHQYNVICKCPKRKFEQYEPIFMHVIQSIGH